MKSEGGGAREAERGRQSEEAGVGRGRGKSRMASGRAGADRGGENGWLGRRALGELVERCRHTRMWCLNYCE